LENIVEMEVYGKKNKKMSKYGSTYWCILRKEFSGMIHFITFVMSSSQQPPATHPFPAKHHMDLVVTKKVNNGRAERFYGSEKNMEISWV